MENGESIGIHFHTSDKPDNAAKFVLRSEVDSFLEQLNIDLSGIEVKEI
jgi:hypothetical protein